MRGCERRVDCQVTVYRTVLTTSRGNLSGSVFGLAPPPPLKYMTSNKRYYTVPQPYVTKRLFFLPPNRLPDDPPRTTAHNPIFHAPLQILSVRFQNLRRDQINVLLNEC